MIGPEMMKQVQEGFEKINKSQIFAKMHEKEKNASPEEQAKIRDIKKNLSRFLANKDLEGAKKYIAHVKKEL